VGHHALVKSQYRSSTRAGKEPWNHAVHEARQRAQEHGSGEPQGLPLMLEVSLTDGPGMLEK
jgi:hypothetical protein